MARSTYFDLGRSADACPGSESGYAQRFQCGNIVKRRIWTRMIFCRVDSPSTHTYLSGRVREKRNPLVPSCTASAASENQRGRHLDTAALWAKRHLWGAVGATSVPVPAAGCPQS